MSGTLKSILVLVAIAASSLTLSGQTTFFPNQGSQPNPYLAKDVPRCTVRGVVVNSVTGEAIPRAQVTMNAFESRTTLADSEGRFSFEDVVQSFVNLAARKPGYSIPRRSLDSRTQICTANSSDFKISLAPTAAIVGRITDSNGDPVESLQVRIGKYEYNDGHRHLNMGQSGTTDYDGRFRLGNLDAGSYVLAVGPSSPQMLASLREITPVTYFPGVPDRASSASIELRPGTITEANMIVREVAGFKVSGRVVGVPPEQRASVVQMTTLSGDEVGTMIGGQRSQEEFTIIGVPAGTYRVRATSYGRGTAPITGVSTVTVQHDVSNAIVSLTSSLTVPVNVHGDGFDATQSGNNQLVSVRLVNLQDEGHDAYADMGGIKSPRLAVRNLESGRYLVDVTSNGRGYVQAASLGGVDILREPVTINSEQDPIDVTLRDDGAELSGTIENASGALVVAIPSSGVLFPPRAGAYGNGIEGTMRFQMTLPPGDYTVYAFDSEGIEYSNPKFMEKYASYGVRISLSAREKKEVKIRKIEVAP